MAGGMTTDTSSGSTNERGGLEGGREWEDVCVCVCVCVRVCVKERVRERERE